MEINEIQNLNQAAALIKNAGTILIGAGAGLSAAAGNDYNDSAAFEKHFPNIYKKGIRTKYQMMGFQGFSQGVNWGYHAMNIHRAVYDGQHSEVYQQLLALVKDKDYFVVTSNVDTYFEKNGFQKDRVYTPQGTFGLLQCLQPCSDDTYDTKPYLDKLMAHLDPLTHEITDMNAIPQCPRCGGQMFINVRSGSWFIEKPHLEQRKAFQKWLQGRLNSSMLVMDMGTGFMTPSVIRWPMEEITLHNSSSFLLRFNLEHADIPDAIKDRAIVLEMDIAESLNKIVK